MGYWKKAPTSYKEAREYLAEGRNKEDRPLANNTRVQARGKDIAVRHFQTDVVTFKPNGDIVLNSGGWRTYTTKERINWCLPKGWNLHQDHSVWYVGKGWNDNRHVFEDGFTIKANGETEGEGLDFNELQALKKKALKYCKGYIKALFNGEVPQPSRGDCWYCLMRMNAGSIKTGTLQRDGSLANQGTMGPGIEGQTWGEFAGNEDHILSHMEEEYYVPSLLVRAIEVFPVSQVAKWVLSDIWGNTGTTDHWDEIARKQLYSSLKRFIYRQLGFAS